MAWAVTSSDSSWRSLASEMIKSTSVISSGSAGRTVSDALSSVAYATRGSPRPAGGVSLLFGRRFLFDSNRSRHWRL